MDNSFSREMGFARDEFISLIPAAINGRSYTEDSGGVTVDAAPGSVRIDVGPQQVRNIASISLPYVKVDFTFNNFSGDEIKQFMRYFDLRYQRGGG